MGIFAKYGQSNLDISIQAYGTFDNIISLLSSNGVTNLSNVNPKYEIDRNLVSNFNYTDYPYITGVTKTLGRYIDQSGNFYITQSGNNYIYGR
jgi:hypothetical protein